LNSAKTYKLQLWIQPRDVLLDRFCGLEHGSGLDDDFDLFVREAFFDHHELF
jgi:hypothetical protein